REASHFQREPKIIERSGLHRVDHLLGIGFARDHYDRKPHPGLAQPPNQLVYKAGLAIVRCHHDAVLGRSVEQLPKIAVDFGVVTERKYDPGLLRARAAVAANDMKGRPVHVATLPRAATGRMWRPRECGVIAPRFAM